MRTLRCSLIVLLFLCSFAAFSQEHCLNISPTVNGVITYRLNPDPAPKRPAYENYPTWYRIKVYYKNNLIKRIRVKRHTTTADTIIVIKPQEADDYCIQVRENLAVGVLFRTIGWTQQHTRTASISPLFLLRPPITSIDGKKGDGIQVLID